jgi:hypothetical protein
MVRVRVRVRVRDKDRVRVRVRVRAWDGARGSCYGPPYLVQRARLRRRRFLQRQLLHPNVLLPEARHSPRFYLTDRDDDDDDDDDDDKEEDDDQKLRAAIAAPRRMQKVRDPIV